jgi:GNAT superfamily N-acetyltransferase
VPTSRSPTSRGYPAHGSSASVFHHHLAILAVRPDRQGQGTGTALLAAHHGTFDWHGIAA